ncbi:MAG: glycosyltransferase family 2 protein [Bauldia sp.]|nr:glycosyltransferase family 2 protein [Bauldia sp.]MCC0066984.1 glycosyltransferase family 2 protein [Rhodovulum sp.]
MRLIVVIVTADRKAVLSQALTHLQGQTRRPDLVIVSAPDASHVYEETALNYPLRFVFGASGCTAQRNRALDSEHARDAETIVFLDDDFVPASDYLERAEAGLARHLDWAVLTGLVIADGIKGPGLDFSRAIEILADAAAGDPEQHESVAPAGAYGCNMVFRAGDIAGHRFDERLPLYGWQEDTDFSRLVARGRPIVRLHGLRGVHLGVKRGRVSGVRLGYSQIVNPVYLVRKGTGTGRWAARLIARNLLANAAFSLRPEPHVDRLGRLKGNLIAAAHLVRGRCDPEFILRL